jgi:hypothetical protein
MENLQTPIRTENHLSIPLQNPTAIKIAISMDNVNGELETLECDFIEIQNDQALSVLCQESEWQNYGLDPRKGLLIMGKSHIDKSDLLENYLNQTLKNRGDIIEPLNFHNPENLEPSRLEKYKGNNCQIRRLGQEPYPIKRYGMEYEVIQEIITNRDNAFSRGNKTWITTDLNPDKILERYGFHSFRILMKITNLVKII